MPSDPPSRPALSLVPRDAASTFYGRRCLELAGAGGAVLVLGSATGKIACELAVQGFDVTGVEPSDAMLEAAAALRATEPPEAAARIRFIQADVRAVRLERKFPVVLAPQNAFGLLGSAEDLDLFLAAARAHLQEDGGFLFDVELPPLNPFAAKPDAPARPEPFALPPRAVFVPHLRDRRRPPGAKTPKAAQPDEGIHRLRLRQFSPLELDDAIAKSGFVALEKFGSFEGKPFDPGDPRVIVVTALQ